MNPSNSIHNQKTFRLFRIFVLVEKKTLTKFLYKETHEKQRQTPKHRTTSYKSDKTTCKPCTCLNTAYSLHGSIPQ